MGRLAFLERCRWLRCRAVHRLKAWRLAGGRHSPPQALVPPASLAGPQATHRGLPSTWPCLAASWSTRAPLPAPPRPRPPGAGAPAATAGTAPAVGPWLGAGPWASSRRARGGRGRPPAPPGGEPRLAGQRLGAVPPPRRSIRAKLDVTVQVVQVMRRRASLLRSQWDEGGVRVQAAPGMQPDMPRSYTQGHGDAAA